MNKERNRNWREIDSAEELKKLVNEYVEKNSIKQYSDLPNIIKTRVVALGLHSYDYKFPKSRMNLDSFVDIDSVQKFIDKQNIEKITDLPKGLRERIRRRLKFDVSKLKFKNPPGNLDNYTELKDFQKLIDEYHITSENVLKKRHKRLYQRILNLKILGDLKFPTHRYNKSKWGEYKDLKDFQEFIIKENILSKFDFGRKFQTLYKKAKTMGFLDKLKFPENNRNLKPWDNLEKPDIEKYIMKNMVNQFSDLPRGLKGRIRKLGLHSYDFNFNSSRMKWDNYDKDMIQKFIISNNILQFSDLPESFKCRVYSLGLRSRDFNFPISFQWWDDYNDLESIKNFIEEKKLTSAEFMKYYNSLYKKSKKLGYSLKDLGFPDSASSTLEIKLEEFLIEGNIKFEKQKTFEDLGLLRFDFWIPEFNLILEPGGDQHFISVDYFGGEEKFNGTKERDLKKYEYCKSNGITIIYFFNLYNKEAREKLFSEGYIPGSEYYTDWNLFTKRILELTSNKGKAS